jgi:hypothetical protein
MGSMRWPMIISVVAGCVALLVGVALGRQYQYEYPAEVPPHVAAPTAPAAPASLTETSGPLEIYADRGLRAPFRIVDRELGVACYGQWGTSVSCVKITPTE